MPGDGGMDLPSWRKGMQMDRETNRTIMSVTAGNIRALIIFYAVIHAALLVVLGIGGSGLEDSGIQLALAALAVVSTVFTLGFVDDAMRDLHASWMDVPDEDLGAHTIKRREAFRSLTALPDGEHGDVRPDPRGGAPGHLLSSPAAGETGDHRSGASATLQVRVPPR